MIETDKTQENPDSRDFHALSSLFQLRKRPRLLRPLAWRILITIAVLIALTLVGLMAGASLLEAAPAPKPAQKPSLRPVAQDAGSPQVFAFYYSWFDENSWNYDVLSDLPSEPYVSRDRGVMGRHIDQAKNAGIDALILAWYGPAGGANQTEPNLTAMLDEAAARGFRIGILFETDGPFFSGVGDVTAALQHARETHFNHPAYLRVDGRPVVFFWRPTIYGVDTWRNIRAQSDPDYNSIWISEGVDTSYLSVFDGHHLYSNTWNPPADLHAVNRRYAGEVASARERLGSYKFWVATVMPGYDDVRIRAGAGGFAQDRQGGAYYARAWEAAMASNPNWIVINSFNEWPEGSYIEPSVAHGDHYINLTGQYSGRFKSGGGTAVTLAPPEAPEQTQPEPAPEPTPTPEPDSPTAFVNVAALNLRAGPGVDFPVLTQLGEGAALPITGRHPAAGEWWQVAFESQTGWVHQEFVASGGPLEQVATLDDAALPAPPEVAQPESESDTQEVFAAAADPSVAGGAQTGELETDGADVAETGGNGTPADTEAVALSDNAPVSPETPAMIEPSNLDSDADHTDNHLAAPTGENPNPDTATGATHSLGETMHTVTEAIRTSIHPILNPSQETLYPHLSR